MQNPPPRLRRAATTAAVAADSAALLSSDFQGLPATLAWPLDPPLQVVLPCVDVGRQTICMMVQTANQGMLGLVQMCGWDAISPQWQPAGGANLPVVIWTCSGTIPAMPESLGGIGGAQQWTVSGSDQFYAADIDGDGIQEIIAVQNGMLAVLKWAGSALYVMWNGGTVPGTGGAGTWTPQQTDSYVAAAMGAGYNIIAAIKLYGQHCAICHGTAKGDPSASPVAKGLYPRPPQLAAEGVEDDPEGFSFWKIKHGIRWTGMPSWGTLTDQQIWTLALFLKHMDKLPPAAEQAWQNVVN